MSRSKEAIELGWWEYVLLPSLGHKIIKAKCDTGATLSAIHTLNTNFTKIGETQLVEFQIDENGPIFKEVVTRFIEVKSSNGESQNRPIILLPIILAKENFAIECTLTDRASMNFEMLIGRNALSGRYLINSSFENIYPKPRNKK